jgi:FlaA1/EpsC-like NDP-sugar epimerase
MLHRSGEAVTSITPMTFGSKNGNDSGNFSFSRWLTEAIWNGRIVLILMAELLLVTLSLLVNLFFFAPTNRPYDATSAMFVMLPLALALRCTALRIFGICERSFRHAGIADAIAIAESVGSSSLGLYLLYLVLKFRFGVFVPGSVFFGDAITLFLLLSAFHFGIRIYNFSSEHSLKAAMDSRRAVIIGAGDAGVSVLKELLDTPRSGVVPVALVDDDPAKRGTRICGVPVAGSLAALIDVLYTFHASEVLICIPSATQVQRHRILAVCRQCGVPVRTLPCVADLLNHRASSRDLRAVSIEDALLRERFVPDHSLARSLVDGKVVLVTGAGGSIGSELCKQLAAAGPARLVLVDKSENGLFYCHLGIEEAFPGLTTTPVLADVTDQHQVQEAMLREQPDIVFHAAAFKHVGMMELHPDQAIRNNVLGTRNVLTASVEAGVSTFVNVSTDKAVNPRCFMGLSKKLTELLVKETAERYGIRYMNVRFGNVAGSTGSVLRIFAEQIKKGKPLRVTDPHATRYFMSIPEAVNLILCAAALGRGGETFIFNMGNPVNIYELARTLTLFAGIVPGEELPIYFTGLKDGEKVAEELWEDWEVPQATENPQIFRLKGSNPLSIDIFAAVQRFQEFLAAHDQGGLIEYVNELVPSFHLQRSGISDQTESWTQEHFARMSA